ncbi:MAG: hypothetical protein OJI67_17025 [Prosthecobacter sp.]|nr:hypothetical protein [Prosthecobacter sp.]
MKKILLTLAVAALTLPALAFPKLGGMRDLGEGILPEASRDSIREVVRTVARHALNFRKETPLSDEQREKLAAVLEPYRAEVRAVIERGREVRKTYAEIVKKHGPESAQAREAAEKIGTLARDRALLIARIGVEAKPLLTVEQQQRLDTARQEVESLVDTALAAAAQ